jgi:ADP-ribose pyrophosphatase YjhB (NUDIX family)
MWSLPAGHLEAKEAPDEAVVRELKEEIGVDTTPENCRLVCAIASQIDTPYLCLFFEITRWEGEPKNIASNEHEKIEWFLESKLPDNLVPELKNYLKAKAEGRCGAIEYR